MRASKSFPSVRVKKVKVGKAARRWRKIWMKLEGKKERPAVFIHVTTHADRRMRARLGTGTNTEIIARRCWDEARQCPGNWYFPHRGRREQSTYYRYGDCVFVFKDHKDGNVYLITIFGPYRPDGSWWKDGVWVRTD